ncbi:proteasome regulatory particle base subunit [Polyrhizophydium stewartii]|uniref:Ribophorin II n=1 Tax=Polyrhizophydium stewartii TaxID=2732419 RepID=A0ABR4NJX4_9FUNG
MRQFLVGVLAAAASLAAVAADPALAAAAVPKVKLAVTGSDAAPTSVTLEFPKTTDGKISVASGDKLTVSFKLLDADTSKPLAAQHVAVAVDNVAAGASSSFLVPPPQAGTYNLVLDLGSLQTLQRLSKPAGKHALTLFVSDPRIKPFAYPLGNVDLDTSAAGVAFISEANDVFEPLPELKHTMRPAEKQPPAVLSYLFTLLTLAPWVPLLAVWFGLGANINNLFASSAMMVYGSGFFGSLATLLFVFYLYWARLTLFDLLAYGAIVGIPTALLGRQVLAARAELHGKSH